MDNYPQQYQPLSHALHPPPSSSQPQFYKTGSEQQKSAESDDDDEGMVEEQLGRTSAPPSPKAHSAVSEQQQQQQQQQQPSSIQPAEPRRRGRPRGSKTRRNRVLSSQPAPKPSPPSHQPLHPTGQGSNPPQLPEVTSQNQQYYEFQWRVLNLCAEFYGAAEELVKATPALVIAQCYQMGPSSKVDPLNMLNEAKQNCDTLLANPSRLISSPPPPMYPVVPTFYTAPVHPPPASGVPVPAGAPAVISQPQSFVVSMGSAAYPMYSSQYPTTPYYQYSYGPPGAYYAPAPHPAAVSAPPPTQAQTQPPPPQPQQQPQPQTSVTAVAASPATSSTTVITGAGNSGTWSEEETERLKRLVEDKNNSGEIDWDEVVTQWGNSRSRHQILIKATQLGLKESSSSGRGAKRRREADGQGGDPGSSTPTPTAVTAARTSSSTTPSSTPLASPALQHRPKSQSSTSKPATKPASSTPAPPANQPWPMPVVAAVNTSTPSFSHYRPRPTDPSPQTTSAAQRQLPTTHSYMFQPHNGHPSNGTK